MNINLEYSIYSSISIIVDKGANFNVCMALKLFSKSAVETSRGFFFNSSGNNYLRICKLLKYFITKLQVILVVKLELHIFPQPRLH